MQIKDDCTISDISKYLLDFASVISQTAYVTNIFDHSKFAISINKKFDVTNVLSDKKGADAERFIAFILEIDDILNKHNFIAQTYEEDNDKLATAIGKLDSCFIIDYHSNNHMIQKKESKIIEMTKSIKDTDSIIITLKENSISITKEIYENKRGVRDESVRKALIEKLKVTENKLQEYENEKVRIVNNIKILRDECNSMIVKRNNDCIRYYELEKEVIKCNEVVYNTLNSLDNLYLGVINKLMKKHNILITDYLMPDVFSKTVKYCIENLKIIFDTHDLGFSLDTIKNCFLNCNYSESETVKDITYLGNSGAEVYRSQKFQPGFSLKIKSFKMIYYVVECISALNKTSAELQVLKEKVVSLSNAEEQKKLAVKSILLLYNMTKLIFEIMYGNYGVLTDKIIFKGLYERGSISNKVYLSEFQHSIHLYTSKKQKDKIIFKKIYVAALKKIYSLLFHIHLNEFKNIDNLKLHVINIENFMTDLEPVELYNASIIHHKINKRSS